MYSFTLTKYTIIVYNLGGQTNHMKHRELVKLLEKAGFQMERHGGDHDIYRRGKDEEAVPRHKEINESLARHIIRKWNL